MTAPAGEGDAVRFRFRRILMALDSTTATPVTVEWAAALAARLEAELRGLFVEDIDLVKLAEQADVGAYSVLAAGRQALDPGALRRALKVRAAASRQAVEAAAQRRHIRSTFEVRRGRVDAEVMDSARDADLVVIDWTSGGLAAPLPGRRTRPGAIARRVAEGAARSVLLLRGGIAFGGPVLVAYDGSEASEHALAAAAEIAERFAADVDPAAGAGDLEVVLLTGRLEDAARWQRDIDERMRARGLRPVFLLIPEGGLDLLCRAAQRHHVSVMVLGAGLALLQGETAGRLLERIDCSVLLVR